MDSHSHSFSDKRKMREALESKYGKMSDRKYGRLYESWQRRERLKADPNYLSDRVKRIYGDDYIVSGDVVSTPKKNYKSQSHYKHEPIDHNLSSVMDQIRNGTGRYKKTKTKKLGQDYFTREMMRRRDLSSDSSGGGIGIGFIMAFIGVAVMLIIAILIFSEVSDEMLGQQYMNGTSNYPVTEINTVDGLTELLSDNITLVMLLIVPFFILLIVRQIF